MSAEAILYAILTGDSAVTAIVPAARVYAGRAPQDATLPYITYERVTTQRSRALDKWLRSPDVRMQVDCWATKNQYSDIVGLAEAIRKAVETAPREVAGRRILGKIIENEQGPFWEDDGQAYRVIIEPMIRYRED